MNLLTPCCVVMLSFSFVSSDKPKTREASIAMVFLQHRCRDQLRRQGDQDAQRARKNIMPLENSKNMMGWWAWEGWSPTR
jgi:hypothetical protein